MYDRFECEFPGHLWHRVVGSAVGTFDPWSYLEERRGDSVDRDYWEPLRRARELQLVAEKQLQPGVVSLMNGLSEAGLRIGLATSSERSWVDRHLQERDILHRLDAIVTADDVERVKPDPAIYTQAARLLGVSPREALAIEDSPTGALGAHRAGVPCLVVPNEVTKTYEFPTAGAMRSSLADVDVDELVSIWQKAVRI